ncbi:MAG TPA: RcnB family protein [Paracoccaceae bacterium]|nr:RcnB family protein [Paracoccaceae bacterium]
MRGLLIAIAGTGAIIATPASAQHHGGGHNGHSGHWQGQPGGSWQWNGQGPRWGETIDGRWHGGVRAPGGWAAYRRPVRGWTLPSYWVSPGWTVSDWAEYGLSPPPQGYRWSRYYDDAVLIDATGQVWDSRGDIDWESYDRGYDDGYRDGAEGWDEGMGPPPPPGTLYPDVEVMRGGVPVPGATVTTTCVGDCGGVVEGGYFYPPATETTITIPPCAPTVTTTTTTHPAKTYVVERPVKTVVVTRPTPRKTVRKVRKVQKVIRRK